MTIFRTICGKLALFRFEYTGGPLTFWMYIIKPKGIALKQFEWHGFLFGEIWIKLDERIWMILDIKDLENRQTSYGAGYLCRFVFTNITKVWNQNKLSLFHPGDIITNNLLCIFYIYMFMHIYAYLVSHFCNSNFKCINIRSLFITISPIQIRTLCISFCLLTLVFIK